MAPLPADPDTFMQRFGVRICSVFNMTEISSPIMTRWELHGKSCGRLRAGYEVLIVDEHDQEVPIGEIGEITVRSSTPWILNAGYYRMPEKTVQAWRNGWFHTGDAGYVDPDGYYYFVDRKKDALRRRGENISSVEIEATYLLHEEIVDVAAFYDVQLIVMGSKGESDLRGLLLGSTTHRVLQIAPCPVVVVPPSRGAARERRR